MGGIHNGDIVKLHRTDGSTLVATALNTPRGAGDMWVFRDVDGGVFAQNPLSPNLDRVELMFMETDIREPGE